MLPKSFLSLAKVADLPEYVMHLSFPDICAVLADLSGTYDVHNYHKNMLECLLKGYTFRYYPDIVDTWSANDYDIRRFSTPGTIYEVNSMAKALMTYVFCYMHGNISSTTLSILEKYVEDSLIKRYPTNEVCKMLRYAICNIPGRSIVQTTEDDFNMEIFMVQSIADGSIHNLRFEDRHCGKWASTKRALQTKCSYHRYAVSYVTKPSMIDGRRNSLVQEGYNDHFVGVIDPNDNGACEYALPACFVWALRYADRQCMPWMGNYEQIEQVETAYRDSC